MNTRFSRALMVLAVFMTAAILSATGSYLSDRGVVAPPSPSRLKPFDVIVWSSFRYYLAWALAAPAILWLGRQVPLTRERWRGPLAVHVAAGILMIFPLVFLQLTVNAAFGWTLPPLAVFTQIARKVLQNYPMQVVAVLPIYGIILGGGIALRVFRDRDARRVRAIDLQRSLASAQLDALRMKLQPHFLFNTLNAISSLAHAGDTEAVTQVVEHLGTLLRLSMQTSGQQFVTLAEELALLDEYLAIEEIRFKDQLRVVRRVDGETYAVLVPNLILQPLAENAIAHGLSGRIGAGLLEIAACRKGNSAEVEIRDDGPGLPAGWTLATGAGRGLRNVVERLQALYRERGGLDVENGPRGGVVARLRVPFVEAGVSAGGSADHGSDQRDHR